MFNDLRQNFKYQDSQLATKHRTEEQQKQKIKIVGILKSYETLKEWSDLGQWLLKLQGVFQNYPGSYIPKKRLLCKRLAQCLSPIWNKAIHENALLIYDLILQILSTNPEYDLVQDLPLFSLGLFPFFGFASIQCKPMFLNILEKYYYPLKKELLPCMGGLISSIIVGMEDTNEEMMKKVMASLDMACESVGVKSFFGLIWVSIIRSVRCRLGAYKYLMKRWTKAQSVDIEDLQAVVDDEKMPNKSALVVNALLASLEDDSTLVKRAALDFMCSHCKIQDNIFQQQEYLILIEQCLLLFIKLDHAVVRRINNWLFGEEELNEEMPVFTLIQEALRRILVEEQSDPLKILQNWYMQHPETVKMTLFSIGYHLAKYIYLKPMQLEGQIEKLADLQKAGERLIESISSQSELVIRSLFEQLKKLMKEQKQEQIKECIQLIDFCLNTLMKSQFSDLSKVEDLLQFQSRTECLQEFIGLVIKELLNLNVFQLYETQIALPLLELTMDCINKIRLRFEFLENERDLNSAVLSNYGRQSELQKNSVLTTLNQIDIDSITQYAQYYIQVSEYSINHEQELLFPIMSQILLRSQLYLMKHGNLVYDEIPAWLTQLFKSLERGTNKICLCSIEMLIELLKQATLHQNCYILTEMITKNSYKNIKKLEKMESLSMDITEYNCQCDDDGHNYIKQIFEKLWILLDQNYHDALIVEFLLYIAENFQHIFVYVIEQALKKGDQRRFQIFCRITNIYYRKHPKSNTGVGIIQMLNCLENENPLIRYNAKTWLSESAPFYFRILDPIIFRLQKIQEDIDHKKDFSLELAVDSIKKLQLLYISKEWFAPYIEKTKPTFSDDENVNTYYKQIGNILIQFIVADFSNNEYTKINAISAEVLENQLNYTVDSRNKAMILCQYLNIVLRKFDQVIKSNDQVLQIQLLNLIKVFVLTTFELQKDISPENRMRLIDIYEQPIFFSSLMAGLKQSNVYYLTSRYLNTIVVGIYSISNLLPPKVLTEKIQIILTILHQLLKQCEYNQNKIVKVGRRISSFRIIKAQKQEITNNFQTANIQQLSADQPHIKTALSGDDFEEVMSLTNSIRAIISFFFAFKYEIKDIEQRQNAAGVLVDLLTLNLFFKKADKKNNQQQPQFQSFADTCQMLLKLFPQIISSFLECWRCSLNWDHLSTKGTIVYEYEKFDEFNRLLKEQLCKQEEEFSDEDQIKQSILQLLKPCAIHFTQTLIGSFLQIWQSEYSVNFYAEPKINQNMCKLIELAITLQISPDDFMTAFVNTPQVQGIMLYYQKNKYKKGPYQFNYDQATFENGILFFLYTYFSSVQYQSLKYKELIKLWNVFLIFSKALLQSKHVNTVCFVLEIIYMMSWKFSPKEVLEEFRKELHTQLRQNLVTLAEIASQQQIYTTYTMQSVDAFSQSQFDSNLQLIVPFTPTIYELYQEYYEIRAKEGEKTEEMWNLYFIQRNLFDPYQQKGLKLEEQDFSNKCSLIAIKTLKRLSQVTLINTYEASRSERIIENTKEFMAFIFPLMANRNNLILVEAASELLYTILKHSKEILPQVFLQDITELFNQQEFFRCTGRSLKFWTEIIDMISDKNDLLMEQLGNNSKILQGFAGLFTSKSAEILKKTKGFERVCFIIYSGGVDKYQSKLSNLLDAILSVIKDINQQHDAITILIIFCIRILVLRLSQSSLTQVFRKIWPYLVSMLMQIFDRKGKQANPYILIAGLKLLELFSLFQLEEFYFYEWIFVFDYFGITINHNPVQDQLQQKVKIDSPYKFIPYMAYQFPLSADYSVDYENKLYPDQLQQNLFKKKRLVKIKDNQDIQEFESKLRQQALYLCQHLIDINQQRVEVLPQSLEEIIEAEFISLDDYISGAQ